MKIEEQVLSREQMAHLEELGVDVTDASMAYYDISRDGESENWILGIANPQIIEILIVNCEIKQIAHTYTIGDLILKVSNFFNEFSFSEGKPKDMLYSCLCWMAKNKKELIK